MTSSGLIPESTGAQELGVNAHNANIIPIQDTVFLPELRIDLPLTWGRINVKIGIMPMMKLDAITFHSANLNDEDESIVKIERVPIGLQPLGRL